MLLAKVPSDRAEAVRKVLFRKGLGRKDRRILREGGFIFIPLSPPPS